MEIDANKNDRRRFRIIYPPEHQDHGGDVMGGALSRGNVYINIYSQIHDGQPTVDDLEVGQHTRATFNLSGSKAEYLIQRIEDRE